MLFLFNEKYVCHSRRGIHGDTEKAHVLPGLHSDQAFAVGASVQVRRALACEERGRRIGSGLLLFQLSSNQASESQVSTSLVVPPGTHDSRAERLHFFHYLCEYYRALVHSTRGRTGGRCDFSVQAAIPR